MSHRRRRPARTSRLRLKSNRLTFRRTRRPHLKRKQRKRRRSRPPPKQPLRRLPPAMRLRRTAATAAAAPDAVAAPELVEVWRPGGRSDERRPRHDRNRHRHQDRPAGSPAGRRAAGGRRRRSRRRRQARAASDADGATATMISANPAPMRRSKPRRGRGSRWRAGPRTARGQGPSAARALSGQGHRTRTARTTGDKGKFGGGRDKGGRDKGGRGRDKGGRERRAVAPAVRHQRAAARTRPPDRSQFAVCQTGGAQGTAHRQPQGSALRSLRSSVLELVLLGAPASR